MGQSHLIEDSESNFHLQDIKFRLRNVGAKANEFKMLVRAESKLPSLAWLASGLISYSLKKIRWNWVGEFGYVTTIFGVIVEILFWLKITFRMRQLLKTEDKILEHLLKREILKRNTIQKCLKES